MLIANLMHKRVTSMDEEIADGTYNNRSDLGNGPNGA